VSEDVAVKLPKPRISIRDRNEKIYQKIRDLGKSNIVSVVAANRMNVGDNLEALFKPSLSGLNLHLMKDIDKASDRISQAVIDGETIGLCVDFDVDGISSGVVLYLALTEFMGCPPEKIRIHVNDRLKFSYGFNALALEAVLKHTPDDIPTLLITADQGSNDNETVKQYMSFMKKKGVEGASVIISDHHHIQEDLACKDAYAFVNPQRKECQFSDKTICGCVVALFMMVMTREALNEKREVLGIEERAKPLTPLITYACMATIADCVSLKSEINRFIIRKGKHDINHGVLPALQVIRENIKTPGALITTTDIGFSLAPRINADSRTGGDGTTSINFLLSKTVGEARKYWEMLTKRNNNRKDEEKVMLGEALKQASDAYYGEGRRGLVLFLPEGNHGIHGIVASRIKERFNCPTIIFSPQNLKDSPSGNRLLSGSGRSVDNIEIDSILSEIQKDIKFKFGGHTMALGAKLEQSKLEKFSLLFDQKVKEQSTRKGFDDSFFFPFVKIDHILQDDDLKWLRGLDILSELNSLDPFGQRFEQPCFGLNVRVMSFTLIGANKNHVRIKFQDTSGGQHEAMFFNYTTSPIYGTLKIGESYTFAVDLQYNDFYKRLGMIIQAVEIGYNAVS
tara:strand:- start:5907 stop:7778 length:1872 start_codon:yes stop_codon:yes gene_type:complete